MFTRLIDSSIKPDKLKDFSKALRDEVLPIMRRQPGFVDLVTLFCQVDKNRVVTLSFWKTREEAERWERDQFPKVLSKMKAFHTANPKVSVFQVDTSTFHHIAAGMAA